MKHGNPWVLSVTLSSLTSLGIGLTAYSPAQAAPAKPAPAVTPTESKEKLQEIQVTLFGQPCTMSGPFTRANLTLIHEISPEKIPPAASVDLMKKIRTKTTQLKNIPFVLEQYRDHLRKRLSAKIALEEALAQAKKAKTADSRKALDSLLKNLKEHISTLTYPQFEGETKKAFEANAAVWNEFFISPLRERFDGVIQPDTEEEFHKAIRTAKIQYVCSFDEGSDHPSQESAE